MEEGIIIYDSGMGGLSLFSRILEFHDDADITYLADNRFFPYGTKTEAELQDIVRRVLDYFYPNTGHIIIACNTASMIYEKYLRQHYPNVYTVIESTVEEVYRKIPEGVVGIIATDRTVHSGVYEAKLSESGRYRTIALPSSELVDFCESGDEGKIREYINRHFPIFENLDALILGCTHFNAIGTMIDTYFQHGVHLIYSGYSLVEKLFPNVNSQGINRREIILTKTDAGYRDKISRFYPNLKNFAVRFINI